MSELTTSLLVIVIRTFAPFAILRWPLGAAIFCLLADAYDWKLFEIFGFGLFGGGNYQYLDKIFDIWYLLFAFIVVHSWTDATARRTAKVLFLWRFAGFLGFELSGARWILVLTPNIFENFYLFWAAIIKWFSNFKLTAKRLVIILLVLGLPKIGQEAIMHWLYPDQGIWAPFRK